MTFRTKAPGAEVAARMVNDLNIIHYAVSLGHHRSLIYWIPTDTLMASTFRLPAELKRRYRQMAGDGIFRFSVGIEDAEDICAELDGML